MNPLTILMPVYNEGKNIANTIRHYHKIVSSEIPCNIVVCEDGSTDNTKEVLRSLENELPITLYFGEERKGYQNAAKFALSKTQSNFVFMVDSDGQYAPEDFIEGIKHLDQYDIIIGRRVRSKESFHRRMLRSGFNLMLRPLFGMPIHDIDCGYKIIRKEVIDNVLNDVKGYLPYSFNAEFMILAHSKGYTFKEFEINHIEREFGQTSVYPVHKLPKIISLQILGLLKLKFSLRN